jgi:TolB protein
VFSNDRDGDGEIYKVRADGTGLTRLTDNDREDFEPEWGPGGKRIVFTSIPKGGSYQQQQVFIMWADGSHRRRLISWSGPHFDPTWSPNGKWIAYSTDDGDGGDLIAIRPDGTDVQHVAHFGENTLNTEASWSSESDALIFVRNNDLAWAPFPYGQAKAIAEDGSWYSNPGWSPDGDRLVVCVDADDGLPDSDLVMMDLDGSNRTVIDGELFDVGTADWSNNGEWLVYASDRDGDFDLYIMRKDGTERRRLTSMPGEESSAHWVIRS